MRHKVSSNVSEAQCSLQEAASGEDRAPDQGVRITCAGCPLMRDEGDLWGCRLFFRKFSDSPQTHECEFI